jgi:hypothetical protein
VSSTLAFRTVCPLTEAGLQVDALREPEPTTRTEHTEYFLESTPRFIVLRATLPA